MQAIAPYLGVMFQVIMERIETVVESLRKYHPELESRKLELVSSFSSEKEAKEYFRKIYHWEHRVSMLKYQLNGKYFSGFKIKIDLNKRCIKHLTNCYVNIASANRGTLYR